jgi:hypothetical protein
MVLSGSKNSNPNKKIKWKIVKEFPNYEVSTDGHIRRVKDGFVIKNCFDGDYYYVSLHKGKESKRRFIHRIVAKTFIENPTGLKLVDHIDNNKKNNNLSNLRWASHKNNTTAYYDIYHKKRSINQYDLNNQFIKKWEDIDEIIRDNPLYKKNTIMNVVYHDRSHAYKFIWEYDQNKVPIAEFKGEIFKKMAKVNGRDLSMYKVSDHGNVMNSKGKIMRQKTQRGYKGLNLKCNKSGISKYFLVHRLVAHTFIPNDDPKNKTFVNHKDEIKHSNHVDNLEWATPKENAVYSLGLKINMIDISTGLVLKKFNCMSDACRFLGKDPGCGSLLKRCCGDIRYTAFGYGWLLDLDTSKL